MKSAVGGLAAATALAAIAGAVSVAGAQGDPAPNGAATVDMSVVLKAAQIDPMRADQTPTSGAKSAVTLVEQALHAQSLLDTELVDGHYGTETVAAYAEFQHSLGYQDAAATGLPGEQSLRKLGEGRFNVAAVIRPGERTTHDGKTVNARTEAMLTEAEQRLDRKLALDQGSYNPGGDPTSAGTHDGGGVVDISVAGMNKATRTEVVRVLRQVGFAAWDRNPDQGDWPQHIHAAAISDPDLSTAAQHQTGDYYLGRNGLADHAADDGPQVKPIRTWEEYQRAN